MRRDCRPWGHDEIMEAVRLRNEGWSDQRIAKHLGRTDGSVQGQLAFRDDDGRRIVSHKPGPQPHIPDWVLADRDRRMSMQYRDLTAAIMRDPLR